MVLFATPKAYARVLDAARTCGVRWFREPGAWVERPRPPRSEPPAAPLPDRLNISRRRDGL